MASTSDDESTSETITLTLSMRDLDLIVDGLHATEYWDYGTELDLPRRNGQVYLPEDDPTVWRHAWSGDEENAIEQIRKIRELRHRLEPGID